MKHPIVMTLLVRDEADIVGTNIEYHLSRGVSHIFATDNLSVDGTTDMLLEYQRQGVLTYSREEAHTHDQSAWVTRMAVSAAQRFPSSIIFHVDADEFWWPLNRSLPEALNDAFTHFDGVCAVQRANYVGPNLNVAAASFLERCRYRQKRSVNVLGSPLPGKVCHPASPSVWVDHGNHKAVLRDRESVTRPIDSVEVLHFPNRSLDQFVEKTMRGASAVRNNPGLPQGACRTWLEMDSALQSGEFMQAFPEQFVTGRDIVERMLRGELAPCQKLGEYIHRWCGVSSARAV